MPTHRNDKDLSEMSLEELESAIRNLDGARMSIVPATVHEITVESDLGPDDPPGMVVVQGGLAHVLAIAMKAEIARFTEHFVKERNERLITKQKSSLH